MKEITKLLLATSAVALFCASSGEALANVKKGKSHASSSTEVKKAEPAPVVTEPVVTGEKTVPPTLKINGFTLFNTYVVNQSVKENGKGGAPLHFATDVSDLYFTIAGQAKGYEYMYRVNFQALSGGSPVVDQNYIQIKTDYYGFRMGSTVGPEDFAIYDASRVIGGAGGFDTASYENVYNLSAGAIKGNDNIGDTGKAAKFIFMGPEYMGFQLFAAYTPNTARGGDQGKNNTFRDNSSAPGNSKGMYPDKNIYPYAQNNWAFAINYKVGSGPWSMLLSGATVHESPYLTIESNNANILRHKLKSGWPIQLGALFGYNDWKLGVGYLNNFKARLPKVANAPLNHAGTLTTGNMHLGNSGQAWNAGLGYSLGAYEFGAAYQNFSRKTDATQKATNNVWTGTVDLNVFAGWKFYFEVDYIKSKTNQTAVDFATAVNQSMGKTRALGIGNNSGTVAILGTKISF